jgi:VWFA-related protein
MIAPLLPLRAQKPAVSGSEYTLRTEVDLLSVAVRVTDRNDNEIDGLTANQFSLYEDGVPQKISFFEAADEPVSLGVLLDVSGSMGETGKLEEAKSALSHIISTMRPADETFYMRFHLQVDKVVGFTSDRDRVLAAISETAATENSTSLYDAIARGLCTMRNARHHRQALLVVTDGADQNSHRSLEDLIPIVQASQAQVFIVGCVGKEEYDLYRNSQDQKIMLVTRKEVDNPLTAFKQLADESGAESFFPPSRGKLQEAVEAVAHQLRTQYTLAYYPKSKAGGFHPIEVRVAKSGARVRARRGFAGVPEPGAGCEDEKLKPYPYESKTTTKNGCTLYHEDFQDVASGWPNKAGYHYRSGTYEIQAEPSSRFYYGRPPRGAGSNNLKAGQSGVGNPAEGVLVANGPLFDDLNASVTVEWAPDGAGGNLGVAPGLVFRLNNRGYYAVIVSKGASGSRDIAIKLVKKYHSEPMARDLIPWMGFRLRAQAREEKISVQCRGPAITILLHDTAVAEFKDDEFKDGLVGLVLYGAGRAAFRDLVAEEAHGAGLELAVSHETSPPSSAGATSTASPPPARGERAEGPVLTPLAPATAAAPPPSANPAPAQTPPTKPPFRITVERNLVVVGVVVRDAKGQAVGDLHKEDFRLSDDGKPQEITSFAVEVSKPQPAAAAPAEAAPAAPASTTAVAPPPPAAALPQRFIAFFFDDLHATVDDYRRTRDAAGRYLTTVRPQDYVALFTASGTHQVDFTSDQKKLQDALLRLKPLAHRSGGCPEIDEFEAYMVETQRSSDVLAVLHDEALQCTCGMSDGVLDAPNPMSERPSTMQPSSGGGQKGNCARFAERDAELRAKQVWSYAEMQARHSLQALEDSVSRLAAMPGQRSLVLVSAGFLTETQAEKVDAIINRALQKEVVISAIYSPGLEAPAPDEEAGQAPQLPPSLEVTKNNLKNLSSAYLTSVLAGLSSGTGGVFFYNNNDFDEGFRRAAAVPEVLYVLTFSPQDLKLNGKFHSLKVTLNHREHFTIQARRGYFAFKTTVAGAVESTRVISPAGAVSPTQPGSVRPPDNIPSSPLPTSSP